MPAVWASKSFHECDCRLQTVVTSVLTRDLPSMRNMAMAARSDLRMCPRDAPNKVASNRMKLWADSLTRLVALWGPKFHHLELDAMHMFYEMPIQHGSIRVYGRETRSLFFRGPFEHHSDEIFVAFNSQNLRAQRGATKDR